MAYISFKNVCKEYKMGEIIIKALENTNFDINKGELVVIVGPSGAVVFPAPLGPTITTSSPLLIQILILIKEN